MWTVPKQHIPNIPSGVDLSYTPTLLRTPVLIPPFYDQVLKEATIEPISTDEILIPHEHFIQQRKRFYEQAYVVGHDYNESRTLFERLKDYILNAYKPFKIVVKDYDSRHGYLTITIYYERNIMSEMILT